MWTLKAKFNAVQRFNNLNTDGQHGLQHKDEEVMGQNQVSSPNRETTSKCSRQEARQVLNQGSGTQTKQKPLGDAAGMLDTQGTKTNLKKMRSTHRREG